MEQPAGTKMNAWRLSALTTVIAPQVFHVIMGSALPAMRRLKPAKMQWVHSNASSKYWTFVIQSISLVKRWITSDLPFSLMHCSQSQTFSCFNYDNVDGQCDCSAGFERHPLGFCVDIDECRTQRADCPPEATCVDVEGSYLCVCPDGQSNCTEADTNSTNTTAP